MEYENTLIREMNDGPVRWCSACERDAEDCVCEELCDWFREVEAGSDDDVCVPASSESRFGLEQDAYTHKEAEARRKEWQ